MTQLICSHQLFEISEGVYLELPENFDPSSVFSSKGYSEDILLGDRAVNSVAVGLVGGAIAGSIAYTVQPRPVMAQLTVNEVVTAFNSIATGVGSVASAMFPVIVGVTAFGIISSIAYRFIGR